MLFVKNIHPCVHAESLKEFLKAEFLEIYFVGTQRVSPEADTAWADINWNLRIISRRGIFVKTNLV